MHLKHIVSLLLTGILLIIISCHNEGDDSIDCSTYDYSDCNTSKPTEGRFYMDFTINAENTSVPLIIYKGKLEQNDIIVIDTIVSQHYDTLLPIDNYYTATAKYKKGSSVIIAVDGGKISRKSKTNCDSTCWEVKTYTADLRLK